MVVSKIVAILNLTPDSFFDGGQYFSSERAVQRALKMEEEGADWIDIGAESTRPGSKEVSFEEEFRRLKDVLPAIMQNVSIPVSIDTRKAKIAAWALDKGVSRVNDVSACQYDPEMASVIADSKASFVLMHALADPEIMQDAPSYRDVCQEVYSFFQNRLDYCDKKGIPLGRVILDPGIGFGKTSEHNLELLKAIPSWKNLKCPFFIGVSRKSFFKDILGREKQDRLAGSLSVHAWLVKNEIEYIRVHDVKETFDLIRMWSLLEEKREGES
ncbi:dihydropteroate synthase [PVC group bacterium (ex Bugula neritina AB1)]|nr:dihydropteroate synthase [PVC group bacterium (ex Bugula neritina AB1)]